MNVKLRFRSLGRKGQLCFGLLFVVLACPRPASAEGKTLPKFAAVQRVVERRCGIQRDENPGDILSRSDVRPVLAELEKMGWKVADRQDILDHVPSDQDFLVRTLRTPAGRKFMSKVSQYRMIYDRLDRISAVTGGQRLIQDLVKLPDGQRYAAMQTRRGTPDLLDLLPKDRSGKTRRVADYEKPTGKIYTSDALLERLKQSHARALEELGGKG